MSNKNEVRVMSKAEMAIIVIVTCIITSILTCSFVTKKQAEKNLIKTNETINITVLEHKLQSASDLVTQKYEYIDEFTDEQSKKLLIDLPFTKKHMQFTYHGSVSVGYDLSHVKPEIDEVRKRIIITLPELKIIANEIDPESYEYIVHKDGLFNRYTPEDMTEFQKRIKRNMQEVAEADDELAAKANKNAGKILTDLLESTSMTGGYEIVIK